MAKEEVHELQKTSGKFALVGFVKNINADKAYQCGTSDRTGNDWQRLKFGVETSPGNTVYVDLMGSIQDSVYVSKAKKGGGFESKTVDWDDRYDLDEGWHLLGVKCYIEEDDKGSYLAENKHTYDAVDYIKDFLEDGDCVKIAGRLSFNTYEDREGNKKTQTKFDVNYVSKLKNPVNFEDEKFKEISSFETDFVVRETSIDRETNKGIVQVYVINKVKNNMEWVPAQFIIDGETSPKMIENFPKKMKFGDLLTVNGKIVRLVEKEEVLDEIDEFGSVTAEGLTRAITNRVNELRITAISKDKEGKHKWQKKWYKEEQFVNEAEEDFGSDSANQNPFADDPFGEDNSDELPF